MNFIFKLGDHNFCGISLGYYDVIKAYQMIIAFLFVKFELSFIKYGFRFGIKVGNSSLYIRIKVA